MRLSSLVFALSTMASVTACGVAFSASPAESGDSMTADAGQGDSGAAGEPSAPQNVSGSVGTAGDPAAGGSGGAPASVGGGTSHSGGSPSDNGGASGGTGGIAGTGIAIGGGGTGGVPACLDAQTSDANCGACGYACVNGRHCSAGRCTPAWQPISEDSAPSPRTRHAAVFAHGKYVVLGGTPLLGGIGMNSVALYDPVADIWSDGPSLNSARCAHEAVSTGNTILTFGGLSDCGNGTTTTPGLESLDLGSADNGWSVVDVPGEPEHRYDFAATWTGTALFVYGGGTNGQSAVASGGVFTPASSSWTSISCPLIGCARSEVYGVFRDDNSIRVWGEGLNSAGLSYDLVGRSWSAWTVPTGSAGRLSGRFADDGRRIYFLTATNVVSVYDRKTSSWLANDTAAMPVGFCTEAAAAWTGSELVAWSGSCGGGAPVSVGGRYQPAAP